MISARFNTYKCRQVVLFGVTAFSIYISCTALSFLSWVRSVERDISSLSLFKSN